MHDECCCLLHAVAQRPGEQQAPEEQRVVRVFIMVAFMVLFLLIFS